MVETGRKYTCYSCHTKFFDLGKPVPVCPKCGADQRDADETPVFVAPRRRVVAPPAAEDAPADDVPTDEVGEEDPAEETDEDPEDVEAEEADEREESEPPS
jgi:hypothetical protein